MIPFIIYHGCKKKEITTNQIENVMIVLTTYNLVTLNYAASLGDKATFFYLQLVPHYFWRGTVSQRLFIAQDFMFADILLPPDPSF